MWIADLRRWWVVHRRRSEHHPRHKKLLMIQFGGAPGGDDWYRTLDAIVSGRLDPRPSIGMTVGLEGLPDAIDLARGAQGPPRIIVHPDQ